MIERFSGDGGRAKLVAALGQQMLLADDRALAERIASAGHLVQFSVGHTICEQGGSDDDVFFILNGTVDVFVNHQKVATRVGGDVVGEMAAIDPGALRSATLKASSAVMALTLTAVEFEKAAETSTAVWRHLARLIATRLRERARFHLPANPIPIMFVGSSVEGLPVAKEIQAHLKHDNVIVRLWTSGVFGPSGIPIDDLVAQVEDADFALFVFGPDDKIETRDQTHATPRDNVVFEMGLFLGRLGRERVFMVRDADVELKIPSDLSGLNPITYKCRPGCKLAEVVGPACMDLQKAIEAKGVVANRMKLGR